MRTHQRWLTSLLAVVALSGIGAGTALAVGGHHARHSARHHAKKAAQAGTSALPVKQIEKALQIQGTMINGDLTESFERDDINNVTLHGVPIKPAFMINGDFDFQSLGKGRAFMNGDFPVLPAEINPAIDAMVSHGLVFQAEHQHMYDFTPQVYFIHLRATGDAVKIAQGLHAVLKATSTPLPQTPPSNPKTPLNVSKLKSMLHGYDAEVGSDGVVTVYIARRNPIYIDGIKVNPATNIATNISFEPLNKSGSEVAAIPDFAMTANEINPLMATMRAQGWDIGCLYNQETDEQPQLFFSHQFKTGNPYELAGEMVKGLAKTNNQ